MGAPSRFRLFADMIADRFATETEIADVASGGGQLQAELRLRGFPNVTSWDRRPRNAKTRRGYIYGHFDYRSAPRKYGLVVGMHPDGATDQIVAYAAKHRCPFVVCPCCVIPSATQFHGVGYDEWVCHLRQIAADAIDVETLQLPMDGRNLVLVGQPKPRCTRRREEE